MCHFFLLDVPSLLLSYEYRRSSSSSIRIIFFTFQYASAGYRPTTCNKRHVHYLRSDDVTGQEEEKEGGALVSALHRLSCRIWFTCLIKSIYLHLSALKGLGKSLAPLLQMYDT